MGDNTILDVAAESAKALTKFQEIIQKIFGPKWTNNQTDADMDANKKKLQLIRDNPDMEIVFIGEQMHARLKTDAAYAYRAEQRMLCESVRQEKNIENVLEIAADQIKTDEPISEKPVDEDWLIRLFSFAKDISSTEMQFVWGKILAGEIMRPGSFSLRTLETVRNISQHEAEMFQRICPLVLRCPGNEAKSIEDYFVLEDYITNHLVFEFCDLQQLEDAGLITVRGFVSICFVVNPGETEYIKSCCKQIKITNNGDQEIKVDHGAFFLTKAGKELYTLLAPSCSTSDEYLDEVIALMKEKSSTKAFPETVHFEINESD